MREIFSAAHCPADIFHSTGFFMKARSITSAVYMLAVVALCAAKWFIPDGYGSLLFDALFAFIAAAGAFELLRAFGGASVAQRTITITFCALCAPLYTLTAMLAGNGWLGVGIALGLGLLGVFVAFVADHSRSDMNGTLHSVFALAYVGLLTAVLSASNHLAEGDNSMYAMLFLFFSVPFSDAGAYLVGMALGKTLKLKLAPHISPNKTVVGAFGGLIGGMAGGIVAYYILVGLGGTFETFSLSGWQFALVLGVAVSVAAQLGDLFESAIKRSCGIKDMGNLLPGHGGIMDRFDGTLFAGAVIFIAFALIA